MKKWQRIGIQFFDDNDQPVGDMRFAVISDDRRAVTATYATLSELDSAIEASENHRSKSRFSSLRDRKLHSDFDHL